MLASAPSDWHKMKFVVGSGHCDMTLAYSHMLPEDLPGSSKGAVFDLYDPLFGSLGSTELFEMQLDHLWEADVDLMTSHRRTLLGLA